MIGLAWNTHYAAVSSGSPREPRCRNQCDGLGRISQGRADDAAHRLLSMQRQTGLTSQDHKQKERQQKGTTPAIPPDFVATTQAIA